MTQVTVPVCLHTDNLTAMSSSNAYSFVNSGPSEWIWDHDLITRMGPLLMQVRQDGMGGGSSPYMIAPCWRLCFNSRKCRSLCAVYVALT